MEKLVISVEKFGKALHFLFTFRGKKVYFDRIPAFWFDSFESISLNVFVLRNKKEFDKGHIRYYGTHGASEFFFGLEKSVPKEKQFDTAPTCSEILASYFKKGDIVQIDMRKTRTKFFDDLIRQVSFPGDKEKYQELSKISLNHFIKINEKHKGNEMVIKMLNTRYSNKEQRDAWVEIERRKKLKIIVGTT